MQKNSFPSDESSILHHNVPHLPATVSVVHLSDYKKMDILHHWNEDFTLITIIEGHPILQINKKDICLNPDDSVLINIRRKHRIYSPDRKDSSFICILASPQLILANFPDFLSVNDLAKPEYPSYYILPAGTEDNNNALQMIHRVLQLSREQPSLSTLRILGLLHLILAQFMLSIYRENGDYRRKKDPNAGIVLKMENYIYQNYRRKLSLQEIADAGGVSYSWCCTLFKKYSGKSPMTFVNDYRLSISSRYLVDLTTPISDIADTCGFPNPSYYTKLFVRKYGCTPNEFRIRNIAGNASFSQSKGK